MLTFSDRILPLFVHAARPGFAGCSSPTDCIWHGTTHCLPGSTLGHRNSSTTTHPNRYHAPDVFHPRGLNYHKAIAVSCCKGWKKVVRPGGFELPTFWFVANGVKMLNALFGVAYGLETPFFPQLAAPNLAPKTNSYRARTV
jgi:hypothetical protein